MILAQILENISYSVLQGSLQQQVTGITEYSGDIKPGMVYCCIRGRHADGHHLAEEAAEKGATALIVERPVVLKNPQTAVILVSDTRRVTGQLSAAFYGHPANHLLTIGITGTKGKTTLSYMIQSILQQADIPCGIIGTNGYGMGRTEMQPIYHTTPTACQLQKLLADMVKAGCQAAVLEVSSIGLKEKRCSGMVFDYGIFTNFAPDHIGGAEHRSLEEYLHWKIQLFSQSRVGIVNLEEPVTAEVIKRGKAQEWIGYTLDTDSVLQHVYEEKNKKDIQHQIPKYLQLLSRRYQGASLKTWTEHNALGMTFQAILPAQPHAIEIKLPMPGHYNASNALAAAACCMEAGCCIQSIQKALFTIRVSGRTEVIGTYHGAQIMVDYAHNASGLEKLLQSLRTYHPSRILCVFGCGGNRSKLRRTEMGDVGSRLADILILTEDNSREESPEAIIQDIVQGIHTPIPYYIIPDRKTAITHALNLSEPGDFVIIAGKGHENYQEKNGVRHPFSDKAVIEELLAMSPS